jgi:hypothetical protein
MPLMDSALRPAKSCRLEWIGMAPSVHWPAAGLVSGGVSVQVPCRQISGANIMGKLAFAAAALVLSAVPAVAEDLYFQVINNSSLHVDYFYASPSNSSDWGPDLLGPNNRLHAWSEGTASIEDGSDQCLYDFKYIMSDGQTYYEERIDLCSLGSYTIYE